MTHYTCAVQQTFNKAVMTYDTNCIMQAIINWHLLHWLQNQNDTYKNIIDMGCGTGINTETVAKKLSYEIFYGLDIANELLTLANERLLPMGIKVIHDNFQTYTQTQFFDLVYANMALHWAEDFKATLVNMYQNLIPNGLLAFSIPLTGTFAELNFCARQRFYNAGRIIDYLNQAGFKNSQHYFKTWHSSYPSPFSALQAIKAIGANYVTEKLRPNHLFKLRKIIKPFTLTYNIGFFIGKK